MGTGTYDTSLMCVQHVKLNTCSRKHGPPCAKAGCKSSLFFCSVLLLCQQGPQLSLQFQLQWVLSSWVEMCVAQGGCPEASIRIAGLALLVAVY